ncbi:hypothetical protein QMK19_02345 [Streptomyces sp. H10-C2]|uniref:hypothetical protein n=1 Tax=unclassified Streptomyces TaxID=2593676 RepID=UPI0024B972D8|nr:MULTISPECIES: hypothetical protein [unclassified Streptomyces]MDJ0342597.1 hypothetical protein [Streptomyces sp. PH10-H1]MDJ0368549.1 hypothetical protein [Streptomyces sp. H10-C2]
MPTANNPTQPTRPTPAPPRTLSDAEVIPIADVVARYRLRLPEPRLHRVAPRFTDAEWNEISRASMLCEKKLGGFVAAAAVAASRPSEPGGRTHQPHLVDQLMRDNHACARAGRTFNALVRHLNSGGTLPDHTDWLLHHLAHRVAQVGTAVTALTATHATGIHSPVDMGGSHRHRTSGPRTRRVSPRFSDREWAGITIAATLCGITPGAYTAAAALNAANADNPQAVIADTRQQLEELMEANRLLAALANNTTQFLRHLNPDDTPHDPARRLLHTLGDVLDRIDATASVVALEGHAHP